MSVILVRVDDRLIHGQIVEGWLKPMKADHILVVSDEVIKDKMQQILLSMAVPSGIKFTCLSAREATLEINEGKFDKDRLLILTPSPGYVLKMIESGLKLGSVNIGGMHYMPGKKQILKTLSVDEKDISDILKISSFGVEVEGRVLPGDEKNDIAALVKKEAGLSQ